MAAPQILIRQKAIALQEAIQTVEQLLGGESPSQLLLAHSTTLPDAQWTTTLSPYSSLS
jgi:hypothetical protein